MVKINPSVLSGTVQAPPSKSYAHRAVISAFLSGDECEIKNLHLSADISATPGFAMATTIWICRRVPRAL